MELWSLTPALRAELLSLALLTSLATASVPNHSLSEPWSTTSSSLSTMTTPSVQRAQASNSASSSSSSPTTMPPPTDNAPGGGSPYPPQPSGPANYYFVFLALIMCVAGLGTFFIWRRKRRHLQDAQAIAPSQAPHDPALIEQQRRATRRYLGRWREAETSAEEGLNEHGEAPPPYVPKTQEEQARERERGDVEDGLAVPLQTLSREQAGLKLPEYAETQIQPAQDDAEIARRAGEGSSQDHTHEQSALQR